MRFYSLIIAIFCALNSAAPAADRPNIIFMFTDDHAYQAISAYGSKVNKTPNIDRIATEGMIFRNSFVTNSICGPSRAVILTGKHSHLNGFRKNDDRFDGGQLTFPKLLQETGYQTAIIGKWHLQSDPQGFDHWEILPGQGHYYNPDFVTRDGKHQESGYVTDIITDKSLKWIGENRDAPFMLMMQHKAPHREWMPGPDHLSLFDDVEISEPANLFDDYATRGSAAREQDMTIARTMNLTSDNKVWELDPDRRKKHIWHYNIGRMSEKQQADWNAAYVSKNRAFIDAKLTGKDLVRWKYQRYMKDYLRCIASVDDSVGRVLDYLQETGLERNTVVMYSSDQGFYLGEHGWFDKRFMYEESMRTPLLVKWPGKVTARSSSDKLVQNLDYAQTMLDIAGVKPPEDMQGASLLPLLGGEDPNWRGSLYYHYYEGADSWHSVAKHEGIRTARYKLIHFYTRGYWELYDLQADPHEMNNLYGQASHEEHVSRLKEQLQKLKSHYKVPAAP
jgi:arylsulfatase A-like enzyme